MAHMIKRIQRCCLEVLCLIAFLLLLPGCVSTRFSAPADLALPPGGADLGAELCNGLLWVDVMIDGRGPYAFLIDTGAEITVIDTAVAHELFGESIRSAGLSRAQGASGRTARLDGWIRVAELSVGGMVARELDVIAMDLSRVADALGRPFDGVVGYPVFRDAVLVVDYPNQSAAALSHAAYDTLHGAPASIPLLGGSHPTVEIDLAGRSLHFLVDTGANTRFAVERLDDLTDGSNAPVVGRRRGVDGDSMSRAFRLDGIVELGPLRYQRPIIQSAEKGNTLGGRAFSDARIAFDQRRKLLFIEPRNDAVIHMPAIQMLDVLFEKLPDGWMPSTTITGTPIEAYGLHEDDRIIALDGISTAELLCTSFETFLTGKTNVTATVRRGTTTFDVQLDVRRELK